MTGPDRSHLQPASIPKLPAAPFPRGKRLCRSSRPSVKCPWLHTVPLPLSLSAVSVPAQLSRGPATRAGQSRHRPGQLPRVARYRPFRRPVRNRKHTPRRDTICRGHTSHEYRLSHLLPVNVIALRQVRANIARNCLSVVGPTAVDRFFIGNRGGGSVIRLQVDTSVHFSSVASVHSA